MGNRLSKLYTRTGDDGTSGLSGGTRVSKNHARMHAMGSVDELNSTIGRLVCELKDPVLIDFFTRVQHDLFNIGGEISMPGHAFIVQAKVDQLEEKIDELNQLVPPLKDFILPGGCPAACTCHIARSIARRAERDLVTLHQEEPVEETTRRYLNRLSDLLFAAARVINLHAQHPDILWKKELA
jgi:cob(I)alamin adenosyltransferase